MDTRILIVYGTRPEAIKMAPVAWSLRKDPEGFDVTLCSTAQHRDMLDPLQAALDLQPDIDLDLMKPGQSLNGLASRVISAMDHVLAERRPDWMLVQGDTTTAMAAAVSAFHRRIRVGHVEAGLRTGDLGQPFPEEANRQIVDRISDLLFAPTSRARDALLAEGVSAKKIHVTGNTVVDALLRISSTMGPIETKDVVLVTVHRRESFGAPIEEILSGVRELAERFPACQFVYPVHRNPNVLEAASRLLANLPNVELREPLDYVSLIELLRTCKIVLTDSGGIQEEAPTFGKPVLVLRERTERPEGIEAGVAKLVGCRSETLVAEASRLLTDDAAYRKMAKCRQPYGDGMAGERIVRALRES